MDTDNDVVKAMVGWGLGGGGQWGREMGDICNSVNNRKERKKEKKKEEEMRNPTQEKNIGNSKADSEGKSRV